MIMEYEDRVEPCKYTFYLVLGCFNAVMSIVFMMHIYKHILMKVEGKTSDPFLDNWMVDMLESDYRNLGFYLFCCLGYYVYFAAMKGLYSSGLRFYSVKMYPMVPQQTFTSHFYANMIMMCFMSSAVTQLLVLAFRGYLQGTVATKMFNIQMRNIPFFHWWFSKNFFIIWAAVWWWIAFIYYCLKPITKIDLGVQVKKTDLSSKQ